MDIEETKQMFGKRVRIRRRELHFLQRDLAEKIEVDENYISCVENGKFYPGFSNFLKLCSALDVTPNYLLFGYVNSSKSFMHFRENPAKGEV